MKDLSVITVTWNSEEQIGRQIESVFSGCREIECEEVIVDNASSDKTVETIRNLNSKFEIRNSVVIIENGKNLGFAGGNNKGLEKAQGEFILFLNPDMRVVMGSLDVIVNWMRKHPEVGIASPKLVDENGKFNPEAAPRIFPKTWEMVAMILKIHHLFPKILNKYLMRGFDMEKEQEVDSVRAAFIIVRRELIDKLGWGFDPRYFIWFEDVDLCRECKRHGFKLVYTPIISCVDYVGQSFKKRDTLWKQKNFTKSMLTYFQKWEPWWKWMWIAIFRPVGIFFAWINDLLNKK